MTQWRSFQVAHGQECNSPMLTAGNCIYARLCSINWGKLKVRLVYPQFLNGVRLNVQKRYPIMYVAGIIRVII